MGATVHTVDSNRAELAIAKESVSTPGTLPGTPKWQAYEANSYGDFGPQVKNAPRTPISASRQRQKGPVVDVDAAAGFNHDLVSRTFYDLMPGFMFADWREKDSLSVPNVTSDGFTVAAGGTVFPARSLVLAQDMIAAGNNGLFVVATDSTDTNVAVTGLTVADNGTNLSRVTRVGFRAGSGDLNIDVSSGVVSLNSTAENFNNKGFIPGEWLFLGGDATNTQFATAACNGFYRIKSVAQHQIVFDRYPVGAATDAGTGKLIMVFCGHLIKNESDPTLQKVYTWQLERKLGASNYEYVKGATANTMAINVGTADKITVDFGFVALDTETTTVAKSGTRLVAPAQTTYNSSNNVQVLTLWNDTDGSVLASYLTEIKLNLDNGVTVDKAIGYLGGFDVTPGDFTLSGTLEAYFTSVAAVNAVRTNPDVALAMAFTGWEPQGWASGYVFDVPRLQLGDGRLKVEKDKAIKLPLSIDAVGHETMDHTLMIVRFKYLPNLAL